MTLKEFATKHQVSFTAHNKRTNHLKNWDGWGEGAVRYDIRISWNRDIKLLDIEFSMGSDLDLPPIEEILECLQLDARSGESETFEEFADELGCDSDSIKALRIYESCKEMKEKLLKFFGTEEIYNEFMNCEVE